MSEQDRAETLARRWQARFPELGPLEAQLVPYGGYWWATFRDPGSSRPRLGGTTLLVDVTRESVWPAPSSASTDRAIIEYEVALKLGSSKARPPDPLGPPRS